MGLLDDVEEVYFIHYAFPVMRAKEKSNVPWDPMKARICDVSRWQGDINFNVMRAQGIEGVCMRATVGNYYTDPKFETYWRDAGNAGLLRSAYHVVAPENSAESQIDRFDRVFGNRIPDFPIVLDCELVRDQTAERITNVIKKCCDLLENFYRVMIYTSQGFWNGNVRRRAYWKNYALWVAHYTTANKPLLPADWDDWQMWQYTSKGNGKLYGASSSSIDLNRVHYEDFLGNLPPSNGGGGNGNGGVPVTDIQQVINDYNKLIEAEVPASVILQVNYNYSGDGQPGNGGSTPPPAPDTVFVQVTDDKALAHFIIGENAQDKPIMEIYPSESSPASERIRYNQGDKIEVYADKLSKDDVDGGEGFWRIYSRWGDNGEHLFLQESKVTKV